MTNLVIEENLPVTRKFTLGDSITQEQARFLEHYGFLHFSGVASEREIRLILTELDLIEERWIKEGRKFVYGIPLFWGRDGQGRRFLQRFAFASLFSPFIEDFVLSSRFEPIRKLVGDNARVGVDEKDGVVVNRYLNVQRSSRKRLGWHTDGLRDLCYLQMPKRMLNVGLHLDSCTREDGGLRLIPKTHRQNFMQMCFRKWYFVSHAEDSDEICVETEPGDVTVHDGRLWHRVAASRNRAGQGVRRTLFVPYLTGAYEPKSDRSRTPIYHHLGRLGRTIRANYNTVVALKDKMVAPLDNHQRK